MKRFLCVLLALLMLPLSGCGKDPVRIVMVRTDGSREEEALYGAARAFCEKEGALLSAVQTQGVKEEAHLIALREAAANADTVVMRSADAAAAITVAGEFPDVFFIVIVTGALPDAVPKNMAVRKADAAAAGYLAGYAAVKLGFTRLGCLTGPGAHGYANGFIAGADAAAGESEKTVTFFYKETEDPEAGAGWYSTGILAVFTVNPQTAEALAGQGTVLFAGAAVPELGESEMPVAVLADEAGLLSPLLVSSLKKSGRKKIGGTVECAGFTSHKKQAENTVRYAQILFTKAFPEKQYKNMLKRFIKGKLVLPADSSVLAHSVITDYSA